MQTKATRICDADPFYLRVVFFAATAQIDVEIFMSIRDIARILMSPASRETPVIIATLNAKRGKVTDGTRGERMTKRRGGNREDRR